MVKASCILLSVVCGLYTATSAVDVALATGNVPSVMASESGDPIVDHIMTPIAQLGFAGAFALASALVWWFAWTRRVDWNTWHGEQLRSLEKTAAVIALNTEAHVRVVDALVGLTTRITEFGAATTKLTEELLGRPCLIKQAEEAGAKQ